MKKEKQFETTGVWMMWGMILGGIIGLLAGPIGVIMGGICGGIVGDMIERNSIQDKVIKNE